MDKKSREEENKKIKRLRFMSDLTIQLIYQSDNFMESIRAANQFRNFVLLQFPGREFQYKLIYGSRIGRVIAEMNQLKMSMN
ncbi:MAG: hypothetical protein Kow00108_18230 [Calditrichia bacterium]